MDLSAALSQFDRTMANVELLDHLWQRYEPHIPTSPAFGLDTPETEEIRRDFADIAKELPAIDGYHVDPELLALDDISQAIIDYWEIDVPFAFREIDNLSQGPRRQLDDYRHRVIKMRRRLVRKRIEEVVANVDNLLRSTIETEQGRQFPDTDHGWPELSNMIAELDRLRGTATLIGTRLGDLNRHIRFAEPHDLRDIVDLDWPSVRTALVDLVFDGEPMTVSVGDLGDLVQSKPTGSVTSRLEWEQLDAETFEGLVFDILRSADLYENVEWLMKTNAPDRGRDISAERVIVDELSGTERFHVLFQCKHWTSRSVTLPDVVTLLAEVGLWSRRFAEVIVVTSGRFTKDAVEWREKREVERESPAVRFWPGPHLEHLLASRPAIRSTYF